MAADSVEEPDTNSRRHRQSAHLALIGHRHAADTHRNSPSTEPYVLFKPPRRRSRPVSTPQPAHRHQQQHAMSEQPEAKTTKDLLKKVEQSRQGDPAPERSPAPREATSSPTQPGPDATEGKKVRSFASYMSNAKQRQLELAEIKRKEEEQKRAEDERLSKAKEEEDERLKLEQREDELLRLKDEEMKEHPAQEPQDKNDKSAPSDEAVPDASSQQPPSTSSSEAATEENHETHSLARNPSILSSELSPLPSSDNKVEYPETIPEGNTTPQHTPTKNEQDTTLDPDEDSEAETVYGDSPPKKRGRLVRKSEFDPTSKPVKKVDFDESEGEEEDDDLEEEDDDIVRKRKKKSYGNLQRPSRSASPGKHHTKKLKAGRDHSGRRMLQRVCEKGNYEQAKALIEEGADVNDQDYAGNTALHEAALSGYTEIVELLLQNGATVDIQNGEEDLDTPLIDAAANGHVDTVKMLLKYGADPRIENTSGQNALDSLEEGDVATDDLKKLLRDATLKLTRQGKKHDNSGQNSDVEDQRSRSRSRPRVPQGRRVASRNELLWMDFTSKSGLDEVYKRSSDGDLQFVGHYLQNVAKPDAEALALAAKFGHTDVVNLFLAFGAKVDLPNENGMTALMRTVGRGHLSTVKLLLDAGADVTKKSDDGKNALDYAMNSLMVNEEEVEMLKGYTNGNVTKEQKTDGHKEPTQESKREQLKKRKLSTKEDEKTIEVKKKKVARVEPPSEQKEHKEKSIKTAGRKPSGSSSTHLTKPEAKRVVSAPKSEPEVLPQAPAPPPPETEEQKEARRLKEIEDEKRRQQYEAERLAKRKAREQEFLSNFETEEKKKEEELRKLSQLEEERKLKEAELHKAKLEEQQKRKEEEMKTEEVVKRQKIRELYPTGLRLATFGKDVRSKEDVLRYLPLYKVSISGVSYVVDLQIIMSLGIEDFVMRYQSELFKSAEQLTKDEKNEMYRFLYPVLVKQGIRSISKRLENYNEELSKVARLKMYWIKYDDLINVIKREFANLAPLFTSHTAEVQIGGIATSGKQEFIKPAETSNVGAKRSVSGNVAVLEMQQKLPFNLRFRPAVVKALARNKKMW